MRVHQSESARIFLAVALLPIIFAWNCPAQEAEQEDAARFRSACEQSRTLRKQGDYPAALARAQEAVAVAKKAFGPEGAATAQALSEMGELCTLAGRYSEAKTALNQALAIQRAGPAKDQPEMAETLNRLGALYETVRELDRAKEVLQQSLKIVRNKPGAELHVARALGRLGTTTALAGDPKAAEAHCRAGLEICEKRLPANELDIADAALLLGRVQNHAARCADAEASLLRAVRLYEKNYPPEHPATAEARYWLSTTYVIAGNLEMAERLCGECLQVFERKLGKDHLLTSFALNDLGNRHSERGELNEARCLLERALAIKEAALGPDSIEVGLTSMNLGLIYNSLGQVNRALELVARDVRIRKSKVGEKHPGYAKSVMTLAIIYANVGRVDRFTKLARPCLETLQATLGPDHPDTVSMQSHMAEVYLAAGKTEEAKQLLDQGIATLRRINAKHPMLWAFLGNLARFYQHTGRTDKEQETLEQYVCMAVETAGPDHPKVAASLNHLAWSYLRNERWDEALEAKTRGRRILKKYVTAVLPGLTMGEQLAFVQTKEVPDYSMAMALAFARSEDQKFIDAGAAWALNGKGLLVESLARQAALARRAVDSNAAPLHRQLREVRERLATLALENIKPGEVRERFREIDSLDRRMASLMSELTAREGVSLGSDAWLTLDAVRSAIPSNAVLIDIVGFRPWDKSAKKEMVFGPMRYAALIVPPQGTSSVRMVDLGPASVIDSAIQALNHCVQLRPSSANKAELLLAAKQSRAVLANLSTLLFRPVEPFVAESRHLLISGDASIWRVPWEAMRTKDGILVLQEHAVSYLATGRELVAAKRRSKAGPPVAFAAPDYNRGLAADDKRDKPFHPLTEYFMEIGTIEPYLAQVAKQIPVVYRRSEACEDRAKELKSPCVLVFDTHGFFGDVPGSFSAFHNPLLQCGLALAGANCRGAVSRPEDDGILTGLEVAALDLHDTRLVILNACNTGIGDRRVGETIAGLRQAFHIAGAEQVVSTLWPVRDPEATVLVTRFLRELAAGQDSAEALRNAKLSLLKDLRKRYDVIHPAYWASFVLSTATGTPQPVAPANAEANAQ